MLISIDHGNDSIKTSNHIFTSGLDIRSTKPPMAKSVLKYEDKYYSLTEKRLKYMWDKTLTDDFFFLTLHGIAKELKGTEVLHSGFVQKLQLAIGLPPSHYGTLYNRFERYFLDRASDILFDVDGHEYRIQITDVIAFPQGYAAAVTMFSQLPEKANVVVIDIGGITTDYLLLRNRQPDLDVSDSIEYGMVKLYQKVTSRISGEFGMCMSKEEIDFVYRQESPGIENPMLSNIIQHCGQSFIDELAGELRERGIDLRTVTAVFTGGGSITLQYCISQCTNIRNYVLLNNIKANVNGYELLYRLGGRTL